MTDSDNILDEDIFSDKKPIPRRKLLPWWMKFFCWIFMIMGAIFPVGVIIGALFGVSFNIPIYGIETYNPLSAIGLLLIMLILFKGITAYGLWTEKDWAITAGITDANIGIIICLFEMAALPFLSDAEFKFRFEIIFLIPYLIKLLMIKKEWEIEKDIT